MASLGIFLILMFVLYFIARGIRKSIYTWKNPEESYQAPKVSVKAASLDYDKETWQVTKFPTEEYVSIKVEHPKEGVWHEWKIFLQNHDAKEQLERAQAAAKNLVLHLKNK